MAGRLIAGGTDVTVWNRTQAKTAPLVEAGATLAPSIASLAAADVVFVIVGFTACEVASTHRASSARPGSPSLRSPRRTGSGWTPA
jgi:3-hydroxyisobutyrate dehydrogenase-like beta-hydroxyacid dehydrogenase